MARENGVYDLRHNRIVVTNNSGKKRAPCAQFDDQIIAKLIFDAAGKETFFGKWTLAEFAERPRETHGRQPPIQLLKTTAFCIEIIRPRELPVRQR